MFYWNACCGNEISIHWLWTLYSQVWQFYYCFSLVSWNVPVVCAQLVLYNDHLSRGAPSMFTVFFQSRLRSNCSWPAHPVQILPKKESEPIWTSFDQSCCQPSATTWFLYKLFVFCTWRISERRKAWQQVIQRESAVTWRQNTRTADQLVELLLLIGLFHGLWKRYSTAF